MAFMERGSTLFLKATVYLMGLAVLAVCVFGLPAILKEAADYFPDKWVYPFFIIVYVSAIPFFVALVQALLLLSYIDRNTAFSERSVSALSRIKWCGIAIAVLFAAALPFLYFMAEQDDAPGLIVIGMVVIGASVVIAVFAAVLQMLLNKAIEIKSENDLTV